MQRSMLMSGESSTRMKLSANGVFGLGPTQPANEKDAPFGDVISEGPGRDVVVSVMEEEVVLVWIKVDESGIMGVEMGELVDGG